MSVSVSGKTERSTTPSFRVHPIRAKVQQVKVSLVSARRWRDVATIG